MRSPPTNCPACEAVQPFRPRQRPVNDNHIEVFIRCPTCNWESILRVSTVEVERLYRLKARWAAYGRASRAKHGVPSSLAQAQVNRIRILLRELEDEIGN